MPLIEVTVPQGTLTKDGKDTLMSQVSSAVLRSEGADPEDAAAQSLVWAYLTEIPKANLYVGGRTLEAPPLRVAVTTPEGALNAAGRKELVAEVGAIIDALVGPFEGRLNHWVNLYEVNEGSWAGAGAIFGLEDIKSAMNIGASKAA